MQTSMTKQVLALALMAGLACVPACTGGQETRKAPNQEASKAPNILLIIADDVGLDLTPDMYPGLMDSLVDQYGPDGLNHPDYKRIRGHAADTPVLNQMAQQGMRFSNAWAEPYCSPSRAALLAGLYPASTHVTTYRDPLSSNHDSFVTALKREGGYSTATFGKWHIAGLPGRDGAPDYPGMKPLQAGFDFFRGNLHAALETFWRYDVHVQDANTAPDEFRTEAPVERSLPGIAPTTYAGVTKTADTIDWIRQQEERAPDRPWFVWLGYNLSHATIDQDPDPMIVPNADTLSDTARAEMEACGGDFGTNIVGDCTPEALMRAMTNSMDTMIGRLLAAVNEIDPNTYVIFVSDNGTPMYNRPRLDFIDNMYITREGRGKGTTFESGAHVAMTVTGPGIKPGALSDEFVHLVDLFPSILDLASLDIPQTVSNASGDGQIPLDGRSLLPILSGKADYVRDPLQGYILAESVRLLENGKKLAAARNGRYKVVCANVAENCMFYDLQADPLEEYPLEQPDCAANSSRDPESREWSYCHLTRVLGESSILAVQQ